MVGESHQIKKRICLNLPPGYGQNLIVKMFLASVPPLPLLRSPLHGR